MNCLLAESERVAQARRTRCVVLVLIAVAVLVRVAGLFRPLLGDFATKNVVYAMIARNWALGRASLFTPTLDCLTGGERSWHLLEVPLPAYLAGLCWQICGGSLDAWGRSISIAASAISVVLLYLLARRWHGELVGRAAAVIFALAPVSIVYGQSFMLEASVVALSLGTIWAGDGWCIGRPAWRLLLAAVLFGVLVLTKIYMLALLLPIGWLLLRQNRMADQAIPGRHRDWKYYSRTLVPFGVLLLAAIPALVWCGYALTIADPAAVTSARVFFSLRESAASHGWPHPLLTQPGFYAGVARNLVTVALTPVGALLLLAGLRHEAWRRHAVWLGAAALLLLVLPRKFHEMNYYYLVVLPPLAIVAALGWEQLHRRCGGRRTLVAVACLGALCSLRYTVRPAFVTPAEDSMVVAAAQRIRAVTPADAWIVTMHGSSIDLLYYADRKGVAISRDEPVLDEKLATLGKSGAALLAVAEMDFALLPQRTRDALARQSLIESGPGYRLYRLSNAGTIELAGRAIKVRE